MSWAIGYDDRWQRDIGYGVPAYCDHPGCTEEIDRGLCYVCGGEPYGGEHGCGLYFCETHRRYRTFGRGDDAETVQVCCRCKYGRRPYPKKPEHPRWVEHVRTDPSWGEWRQKYPKKLAALLRTRTPPASSG